MSYVRFALYGLFFLFILTLFNLWQREHPKPSASVPISISSTEVEGPHVAPMSSLPSMSNAERLATSQQLIKIDTDVIHASIDPKGGNLVDISLPTYPESLKKPSVPYQLLSSNPDTLYIAQSGIRSVTPPHEPVMYQSAQSQYQLAAGQKQLNIVLQGKNRQGILFTKTYSFTQGSYLIPITVTAQNTSSQPWQAQSYEQLLRKKFKQEKGLAGAFHINPFLGTAYSTQEKPYQKLSFKKMDSTNLDVSTVGGWVAMIEHYFLSAWVPLADEKQRFYTQTEDDLYSIGMLGVPRVLEPHQTMMQQAKLYVGPLITHDLQSVAPHLDLTVDYGWLWMISEALFWLLTKIHSVIGNWGWSIVLVTVFIKSLFYKLSESSYRSMAAMRALQPKLQDLRERYADDKQKLTQATMEIYRKEKINPLGGCLPMLVQIPVFLALYWVLFASVELRQAPFILWIKDLSMPDPYYVLPVLMGLSMFIQQKMSPPPPDPTQAKVMMLMPLVLTLFFLNFPAGLVLYWFVNNTLSILQQAFITHRLEKQNTKRK